MQRWQISVSPDSPQLQESFYAAVGRRSDTIPDLKGRSPERRGIVSDFRIRLHCTDYAGANVIEETHECYFGYTRMLLRICRFAPFQCRRTDEGWMRVG